MSEERCGGCMALNYLTMRLEGLFTVEKQWKTINIQNLTLGDEAPNYGPRFG